MEHTIRNNWRWHSVTQPKPTVPQPDRPGRARKCQPLNLSPFESDTNDYLHSPSAKKKHTHTHIPLAGGSPLPAHLLATLQQSAVWKGAQRNEALKWWPSALPHRRSVRSLAKPKPAATKMGDVCHGWKTISFTREKCAFGKKIVHTATFSAPSTTTCKLNK